MSGAAALWVHSQSTGGESTFPAAFLGIGIAFIGVVMMLCYGLNTFAAIAVMRGRRWGYLMAAILLGITAFGSLSGSSGYLTTLPEAAACVYLALRFAGQIGTAPR